MKARNDPRALRVGYGLALLDRPAPSAPSLQIGDRWVTLTGPVLSTLAVDAGGVRSWLDLPGGGGAASLAAVLAVGNNSGPNPILLAPGQRLDTDAAGQLHLGTANATSLDAGTGPGGLGAFQVLINQGGATFLSNAGIQYSSTVPNRAQLRVNLFDPTGVGVPGMTAFRSRGATVGALAGVKDGDILWRATAIGVCGDNSSTPLAGYISIQVPVGGSNPGQAWVATDFAVELTPLEGMTNSHKEVFKITSQGVPCLRDGTNRASGLATLDAAGQIVVANTSVKSNTRFSLSVQEGTGVVPVGSVYQSARVAGTSFQIKSNGGAADAGLVVFWELWEPLP